MKCDLRVAQLLCSRLCHDLVGAAGAVNAGLELIAETHDVSGDAFKMTEKSSGEVTRRLMFFRAAFGLGGTEGFDIPSIGRVVGGLMSDSNVTLFWPDSAPGASEARAEGAKLLLNLCLVGAECLPRGGSLHVNIAAVESGVGVAIAAEGKDALLREEVSKAISGGLEIPQLTARTVNGYLVALIADSLNQRIEYQQEADIVKLAALVPYRL
ncbi:MAG: hypothetical protein CFH06_02009 [Alphaproteobacteria bacterium MarineAlpha3_Bin5]|nr:hypothetical protein [Magnetovibrio sp.]PPR75109.1 MAG: hypothetical protein CFH06_02009 [Alphaproteobacteria bacterium MarineAlpha3_Bin5]